MKKTTLALPLLIIIIALILQPTIAENKNKIVIVCTLETLAKDLEIYKTNNTIIEYIAPGTVEPHSYSLTPKDYAKIDEASIIISSLHIPFEYQIEKILSTKKEETKLIELPLLPGIKIIKNPVTGQPVLHMPTYNIDNFIQFMYQVKKELQQINPGYSKLYEKRFQEIVEEALEIKNKLKTNREKTIIAVSDSLLYALSNLNYKKIVLFTIKEELEVTPQDIEKIEKIIKSDNEVIIAIMGIPTKDGFKPQTQKDEFLYRIARNNNIPILYVIPPTYPVDTLEKIRNLITEYNNLQSTPETTKNTQETTTNYSMTIILSATLLFSVILYSLLKLYSQYRWST